MATAVAIRMRNWRRNNPVRAKIQWQRANAIRAVKRQEIVDYFKSQPCTDCGKHYDYWIMQFDHVPERGEKKFDINPHRMPLGSFIEEVEKCDIVCANCHANRTHSRKLKEKEN